MGSHFHSFIWIQYYDKKSSMLNWQLVTWKGVINKVHLTNYYIFNQRHVLCYVTAIDYLPKVETFKFTLLKICQNHKYRISLYSLCNLNSSKEPPDRVHSFVTLKPVRWWNVAYFWRLYIKGGYIGKILTTLADPYTGNMTIKV